MWWLARRLFAVRTAAGCPGCKWDWTRHRLGGLDSLVLTVLRWRWSWSWSRWWNSLPAIASAYGDDQKSEVSHFPPRTSYDPPCPTKAATAFCNYYHHLRLPGSIACISSCRHRSSACFHLSYLFRSVRLPLWNSSPI